VRALALALAGTALVAAPASADPPEVGLPVQSGVVDAGWARAVCHVRDLQARCHVRVPEGFTYASLEVRHAGDPFGLLETWTYERVRGGGRDRLAGRPVSGVRFDCSRRGTRLACEVDFAGRYVDVQVLQWSQGTDHGGIRWEPYA
jgi:hypothetical protein